MSIDRLNCPLGLLIIVFLLIISVIASVSIKAASDGWVVVSYSPQIKNYAVAVVGAGENIYIANSSTGGTNYFMCYDTIADEWDFLSTPPQWFKNGTCLAWDGGDYIYALLGGAYGDTGSSARYYFYRYSISSDSWERLEDTPGGQGAGDAITWVPGSVLGTQTDWIYAIVGTKWGLNQTIFCRYSIANDSWETLIYNPSWVGQGSDDGSSLVWAGGDYLYALQGEWHETDEDLDRAFARFDLTDDVWEDLPDIPEAGGVSDGGSLIWIGGSYSDKIFALGGGYVGPDETPGDNFYCYDISENSWTQLESLPYGITDQNGPRLGYSNENIYCWRGYYNASEGDPDVLWAYAVPEDEGSLISRGPIYIVGNGGFTLENGVNGGGSGTEDDPYIIENWDISAENVHGIWIEDTTAYFVIRNCYVHDGKSDNSFGIFLENVVNGKVDSNILDNNFKGILLYGSNGNHLENNLTENNSLGIHLIHSDNNLISNNTTGDRIGGIHLSYSENNIVLNNTTHGNWDSVYLGHSDNNLISNNTVENNLYYGIYLYDSDNNFISNNTVKNNVHNGIFLRESGNNRLRNNHISNNGRNFSVWGTELFHFYQDIENSNLVNGSPIYYVVEKENLIFDGSVIDIGFLGLVSCENILVKNLAISNNGSGILLANTSHSMVSDSTFVNNAWGIDVWGSSNNTFVNCHIEDSAKYGAGFGFSSDNNFIYHNNFVNNENQARDDGSNYWDNGYLSGGNYWSDYTGQDENCGENQDVPGSDGIGDIPYSIPGDNNQDRYPLMNPWPTEEFTQQLIADKWNLISFPLTSSSSTPENILENATYYSMWAWDASAGGYTSPPSDQSVELGIGYWLISDLDNMTISGAPVQTFTVSLIADRWNLVGFPVTSSGSTPENLLENATYYSMWKWDTAAGGYISPPPDEPVELGVGYWLITDENRIKTPY